MANSPAKRLQIFVSSTYLDLIDEYQAVIETLVTLGHQPAGMGMFSLDLPSSMATIHQWMDASDVYVLLLGSCYGEVEPESGKSLVQLEYEYAIATHKPIIALVLDTDCLDQRLVEQGSELVDLTHPEHLQHFRQTVMQQAVHLWQDSNDIVACLTEQLTQLAAQTDILGWTRPRPERTTAESVSSTTHQNMGNASPLSTATSTDVGVALQTVQELACSLQAVSGIVSAADQVSQKITTALQSSEDAADSTVSSLLQLQENIAEGARTAKRLAEVSQQMTKIVQLVAQVASRTNIIALNANIEVSRLGKLGEGLLPVASDLRQLANHTAKVSQAVEKSTVPLQSKIQALIGTLNQGIQHSLQGAQQAQQTQQSLAHLGVVTAEIEQSWRAIATATTEQQQISEKVTMLLQALAESDSSPPHDIQQVTDALHNLVALALDRRLPITTQALS